MEQAKPDLASTQQLNAVYKVLPVTATGRIGGAFQELSSQIMQLVQGKEYQAHVVAKLNQGAFLVRLAGHQGQPISLKMDLGAHAKVGQSMMLEFLQSVPTPTFLLKQGAARTAANVNLSQLATQLNQYLKQAEARGLPQRFEASGVVTQLPTSPLVVADDLKQAIAKTGLFYESHLHAFKQGQASLHQIKQEPQNQRGFNPALTTFQQLAVLENQRMAWHGEIWPNQWMHWDVYQQSDSSSQDEMQQTTPVASELAFDFPKLGKVKAKLSLIDGHVRIHFEGEQANTTKLMQQQRLILAEAIRKHGQVLDNLTVTQHEADA